MLDYGGSDEAITARSTRKHRMSRCETHHKRRISGAVLSVTDPVITRTASIYRLRNYKI
jgi:hypothetical protein